MTLAINNEVQIAAWQNNFTAEPSVTAPGTGLTASATIHTKGDWATLIASTTYDSYGFWLNIIGTAAVTTLTHQLMDIAIGAAQENIIVPNFMIGWLAQPGQTAYGTYWFPIYIPKGSAISARIQALISADTARVMIVLNGGASAMPGPLFSGCDAYGPDEATSTGVAHTPGDSGSESADANVGGTLTKNYGAVMLALQGSNTITTTKAYHWELTIGGVTVCEWYACMTSGESVWGPFPPSPFPCSLPFGTQLQVQAEGYITGAQEHGVAFYCFY